jgi:hypothetical protein
VALRKREEREGSTGWQQSALIDLRQARKIDLGEEIQRGRGSIRKPDPRPLYLWRQIRLSAQMARARRRRPDAIENDTFVHHCHIRHGL